MDITAVVLIFLLSVAGVTISSPIARQDVDNEVTTSTSAQPPSAREENSENLVIVAREEEEELLPSQSRGDVFYRDQQELIATPDTTSTQPPSAREENSENLVIVAREEEEEELLPSQSSGGVFYRDQQELIATPVLVAPRMIIEDDLDVVGGELMETANSGLVFRPQFRYRKQSRRRYNRNTRRRYGPPLFFGF